MRRELMRSAGKLTGDASADDDELSDGVASEKSEDAFYEYVPGDSSLFAMTDMIGDPHEYLLAMLQCPSGRNRRSGPHDAYVASALSSLPRMDFACTGAQTRPEVCESEPQRNRSRTETTMYFATAQAAQTEEERSAREATRARGVPYDLKDVGGVHVTHMELDGAATARVKARIEYLSGSVGHDAAEMALDPKRHGVPPTKTMDIKPSIVDTIRLFTLSEDQAFSFIQLADALLLDLDEPERTVEPINMVLSGEPGTEKSQVLKAFEWFCFQYDASNRLLVASFTWRAALMVATEQHPARSTHNAFGLNIHRAGSVPIAVDSMVRFIFLDEYSFISGTHLNDINKAVIRARGNLNVVFSGLHVILCGDPCQHDPVKQLPLFSDQAVRDANGMSLLKGLKGDELLGNDTYHWCFQRVVYLTQQQRIRSTTDYLFSSTRLFIRPNEKCGSEAANKAVTTELCDALQEKVVADLEALAHLVPRVVCLRNEVRKLFHWRLASMHARHLGVRPICWRTRTAQLPRARCGTAKGVKRPTKPRKKKNEQEEYSSVPDLVVNAVGFLPPEQTEKIPGVQFYFPGCRYLFIDNHAPELGYVNNGECIGRGILLNSGEEDVGEGDVWFLRRPPIALYVEPAEATVTTAAWRSLRAEMPTLPDRCVPVMATWTSEFSVVFPDKKAPDEANQEEQPCLGPFGTWDLVKYGVPIGEGYAVTDFYCQGMNFRDQCWLAHLSPPPDPTGLTRASVYVTLSRWHSWDDVKLIAPLWTPGNMEERIQVIDKFTKIARLGPELRAQLIRLKDLAVSTKQSHADQWQRAQEALRLPAAE